METKTYLSFEMHGEAFAVNVTHVLSILEMIRITKVPNSKDYMKGVINLRGSVLPVVDLRVKFDLPVKEASKETSIIVMSIDRDGDQVVVGAVVDSVREVVEVNDKNVVSNPSIGTRYKSEIITGLLEDGEKFIMLLDINRVFSSDAPVNLTAREEEVLIEE